MTSSEDLDQLASEEANWSGSTLFCKGRAYLGSAGLKILEGQLSDKYGVLTIWT